MGEIARAEGKDRPYAPPSSDSSRERPAELPRTKVLVMVLLALVTFGLYIPYWFLSRRRAFNFLAPEGDSVNLLTYAVAAGTFFAFVLGFVTGVLTGAGPAPPRALQVATTAIDLLSRILSIVLAFQIKSILEANYAERLSPVGTFFLSLFYLQYKINRLGQTDPLELEFTLR